MSPEAANRRISIQQCMIYKFLSEGRPEAFLTSEYVSDMLLIPTRTVRKIVREFILRGLLHTSCTFTGGTSFRWRPTQYAPKDIVRELELLEQTLQAYKNGPQLKVKEKLDLLERVITICKKDQNISLKTPSTDLRPIQKDGLPGDRDWETF